MRFSETKRKRLVEVEEVDSLFVPSSHFVEIIGDDIGEIQELNQHIHTPLGDAMEDYRLREEQ